jgi:hypothetical protein
MPANNIEKLLFFCKPSGNLLKKTKFGHQLCLT